MALAILRKADASGVRIDVEFKDRDDAELVWLNRARDRLVYQVEVRSEGRYKLTSDAQLFLYDAAVLAARAYLDRDPLDEPAMGEELGRGS